MFYSTVLVVATALTGLVAAQNLTLTDPGSVNLTERESWCSAQRSNCPFICGGNANPNSCNPNSLTYICTCADGSRPNISDYASTLPSFICQANVATCVNQHPNDLEGITLCRDTVCGSKNASEAISSSSSSASSGPTSTGSGGSSGSSQTSSASSSSPSAAGSSSAADAALSMGKTFGTGALAAGVFAMFGLAL